MNNIYLVGFMGTGKSAVARELSRNLGLTCVDLDTLLEKRQGMAIAEIFSLKGEEFFRGIESEELKETAALKDQVISCGGGIVIDPQNVRVMKETGTIVCLTARPEVIYARTAGHKHRPLLNVEDPVGRIAELLSQRAAAYAQADYTVDTSDKTISQVVAQIRTFLS
jgi:shikimate kinase